MQLKRNRILFVASITMILLAGRSFAAESTPAGTVQASVSTGGNSELGGGAICPIADPPCQNQPPSDCLGGSSSGLCRVKSVIFNPALPNLVEVEACGCVDQGTCGNIQVQGDIVRCIGACPVPPPGNECQVFINGMPSGSASVIFTQYPPGTRFECGCHSPPPACVPLTDGSACAPTVCPIAGQECQPRCILIGFDGVPRVTDCECGSPNECHAELFAGATVPECIGGCPPGQVCIQRVFATPEGTQYCCECVDDPPFCEPTTDGQDCKPFACPVAGENCKPRCVRMEANGGFTVRECDCRGAEECHVEFFPGVTPFCEGTCPPGFTCVRNVIQNADGSFDVCCDCIQQSCECPGDVNGDGILNGLDIAGFVRCFLGIPIPADNCACVDVNGNGIYDANDIAVFVDLVLSKADCEDTPCCPAEDAMINLATGVAADGSLIPVGNDDDEWIVTQDASGGATPRPATVVTPHTAWVTIPGTQWISANYFGPNGTYGYRFCFCLDDRFSNPLLTLQCRGDDNGQVFLNGNFIGNTGAFSSATPATLSTNNPAFFQPGENCVTVIIENIGGAPTGFNMAGTVTADDGKCCCEPLDLSKNVASGVYDNGSGLIPIGLDDDTWRVTVDPSGGITPRPATVITPHPAWLTIPGTQWISAAQYGPNGVYHYDYCFCLDPRFKNATMVLDLRADDYAEVWLNGVQVGATPNGWAFNTPQPTHVIVTNQSLFRACENCLEIRVTNGGGVVTGFNIAGYITAEDGLCCDDRRYSCCDGPNGCINLPAGVSTCPDGTPGQLGPCQAELPCCLPDGSCQQLDPRCCEAEGGTVLTGGTLCEGSIQACCVQDPVLGPYCQDADPVCCVNLLGGMPQGPGTFCMGDLDGNGIDDACQPPAQCGVNPATGQCNPTQCPISGQECLPTCVLVEASTQQVIQVVSCDCKSPNQCHIELSPAPSVPICVGGCGIDALCSRTVTDHGNGTQTICCQCIVP
ncbi:MAG: hypothetical protein HS101_06760 [Planctomycetia bacterium]|nr:hypothetical protein [Planctomycetia bacterium]